MAGLWQFLLLTAVLAIAVLTNSETLPDHAEILAWEAPKNLKKQYPYFLSGFDTDGTPITAFEFGRWDMRATMEKGPESQEVKDFQKYTLQMYTWMYETPNIYKTGTDDYIILVDLEGYDNRQFTHAPTVAKVLELARQFVQANRGGTESIKKVILVNSNYLFSSVYQLVKPILGTLATKIELYGTNKDKWVPVVLRTIPKDQIPEFLGGLPGHKPIKVHG